MAFFSDTVGDSRLFTNIFNNQSGQFNVGLDKFSANKTADCTGNFDVVFEPVFSEVKRGRLDCARLRNNNNGKLLRQ